MAAEPSVRRFLVVGGAWALVGRVGTGIAMIVVNAVLARTLSSAAYAAYFLIVSLVAVGGMAGSIGLGPVAVRYVAAQMDSRLGHGTGGLLRRVFVLAALGGALLAVGYVVIGAAAFAAWFGAPELRTMRFAVGAWLFLASIQVVLADGFRGLHDIRMASIAGSWAAPGGESLGAGVLVVIGVLLAVVLHPEIGLSGVLSLIVGANAVIVLWGVGLLHRRTGFLGTSIASPTGTVPLLRQGMPLLAANVALLATGQMDLWVLGAFATARDVADFGAAARLAAMLVLPLGIANAVVAPMVAQLSGRGRTDQLEAALRASTTAATVPALVAWLALLVFGRDLMTAVYGGGYAQAAPLLVFLGLGQLINVATGPSAILLMMTGRQRPLVVVAIAHNVILGAVGAVAAARYGALGVAVASGTVRAVVNVVLLLHSHRQTGIWSHCSVTPGIFRAVR